MKLSKEVKALIRKEYEEFKESMYAGKSLEERQEDCFPIYHPR